MNNYWYHKILVEGALWEQKQLELRHVEFVAQMH
jgi:hypothetical protein